MGAARIVSSTRATYQQPRPRRFPPPWSVEELDAYFVVRDANATAVSTKGYPQHQIGRT